MLDLFKIAYDLWNGFMAMVIGGTFNGTSFSGLFRISPAEAAGSDINGILELLFSRLINSFAIPIATLGFLFAIIKNVIDGVDGKHLYRLGMSASKYAIVAAISLNAYAVMGGIMSLADDFSTQLIDGFAAANGDPYLHYEDIQSDIEAVFAEEETEEEGSTDESSTDESGTEESSADDDSGGVLGGIKKWFAKQIDRIFSRGLIGLLSLSVLAMSTACAFLIVIEAFKRIIKPLVVMPFACINLAFGSAGQDGERLMWNYIKMFFGFCISGAVMIISIYIGAALINSDSVNAIFSIDESASHTYRAVIISLKSIILPLTITGMVKGAESLASRLYS